VPFRFWLRPRSPSEGVRGGLQLALDRSDEPCGSSIFRGRDAIEPVSAIEPIIPCSPTCPFSPRDSIQKVSSTMSPQCVRACEGAPGCPRTRRRVARFHAASPTGPRLFFRRYVANVVFSQSACGRSPGSFVACDFRLRSRPIPRRPVKDAAFLARRIFHRRVLFPRRSSFDERRSNVLSLARGAGALLETAVSCASHRRVTGCFRFRRHRDSAR